MSVDDIEEMMTKERLNYLIVKSDQCYFGFNLLDEVERGCIFSIINSKCTDAVDGWMVSESMPEWVGDHSDWMIHERNLLFNTLNESPPVSGLEDSDEDDDTSSVSSRKSDDNESFPVSCIKDRKIGSLKKLSALIQRKNLNLMMIKRSQIVIGLVLADAFQVYLQ